MATFLKSPTRKGLSLNLLFLLICGLFTLSVPVYMKWIQAPEKSPLPFSLGILGSVLMWGGTLFYVLRKRVKMFRGLGKMKRCLDVHILLCLLVPMLIIYHSEFSVRAPNSAVAYYAMLVMVFSGFIGRYFYKHFQISLSGKRATLQEMKTESEKLEETIKSRCAQAPKLIDAIKQFFTRSDKQQSLGLLRSIGYMVKLDWLEKKLWLKLSGFLPKVAGDSSQMNGHDRIILQEILKKRIQLEKKISLLSMTNKLFSYWHAFHVPLVFILLLTFVVHVTAVHYFLMRHHRLSRILLCLLLMLIGIGQTASAFNPLKGIMPGEVAQPHEKLEESCLDCHKLGSNNYQTKCIACHDHKDIEDDLALKRGFHGKMEASKCEICHSEHKGRNAALILFDTQILIMT